MLLKLGIVMASLALLLTVAAVGITFAMRGEPEPAVAMEVADKETAKPILRYGELQRVQPERKDPDPEVKAEKVEPEPLPKPKQETTPKPQPKPDSSQEPTPKLKPEPKTESRAEPRTDPGPSPVAETDWPEPTGEQIQAANGPRRYHLPDGAILGLTVNAIGIYNAPVFDTSESWALDSGVRHVPETSMPWSGGAQRNVYLEGHRLGYPGTGSHLIFYNLDTLENGDEVLLRDRDGRRYEYRVIDAFVVDPSDSWVMGQVRGRDLVTLQTCTNAPAYDKRLIVRAERI